MTVMGMEAHARARGRHAAWVVEIEMDLVDGVTMSGVTLWCILGWLSVIHGANPSP